LIQEFAGGKTVQLFSPSRMKQSGYMRISEMWKTGFLIGFILIICSGCGQIIKDIKAGFGQGFGGKEGISSKKLVPAEVDVSKYRKIAVFDFDGQGGKDIAEWMEIALQNVRIDDQQFFEMITRSRMLKLLAEQRLGLTGLIDPDKAAKIGKISGVQAIVSGRVTTYGVKENKYSKQTTRYQGNRQYNVNVPCNALSAYVDFTVNFLDAQNGQIMASSSADGQLVAEECQGGGDLSELMAKMITDAIFQSIQKQTDNVKVVKMDIPPRMLKGAADLAIKSFVNKITPSYLSVPIVILEGDYGGFSASFKEKPQTEKLVQVNYEVGYKYGIRGQWEDAIKQWEKILETDPQRPAAVYNIGVAFEMMGDLQIAEKQFKTAADMRPDDLFFDALARVRNSIAERNKAAQKKARAVTRVRNDMTSARDQGGAIEKNPADDQPKPTGTTNSKGSLEPPTTQGGQKGEALRTKAGPDIPVKILPASGSKTISRIKGGEEIEKIQESRAWIKIKFMENNNSQEGWINKTFIEGYEKPTGRKTNINRPTSPKIAPEPKNQPEQKKEPKKFSPL
jgi:tetratricopeptide (TPR) repeat protein